MVSLPIGSQVFLEMLQAWGTATRAAAELVPSHAAPDFGKCGLCITQGKARNQLAFGFISFQGAP